MKSIHIIRKYHQVIVYYRHCNIYGLRQIDYVLSPISYYVGIGKKYDFTI